MPLITYPIAVGYDAHAFVAADGGTGKGVQLQNLVGPYLRNFVGFAPPKPYQGCLQLIQEGLSGYTIWQQLSLPRLLRAHKIDVFLAPYNTAPLFVPRSTQLILVLHDLILMANFKEPTLRRRILDVYRRWLIPFAVRRSEIVLTVSHYSRQQIRQRFPGVRVEVIPCTISESWFVRQSVIPTGQRDNYVLMVSATPPHKNLDRALQAYGSYLSLAGHAAARLRIAGLWRIAAAVRKRTDELKLSEQVEILPYLTEEELQHLYRHAKAVVVPSLMEGFGIPVLEAMASGTPVISSNATSLPEVGGRAPVYFEPTNVPEMGKAILDVLSRDTQQSAMTARGLAQAERFHPEVVSQQVVEFWQGLATTWQYRPNQLSAAGALDRPSKTRPGCSR